MALSERLALLVTLDGRGAVKGFEQVGRAAEKNLGKSTNKIDMLGKSFTKVGVGLIAAGAVMAGGLYKLAQASEEAGLGVLKLENSLANNSGLAGTTADEFIELASAIQAKTAADRHAIVAGIAVLAQGRLNADQIKELTPLVVDLARKKGIDEVSAFTLASKAVAGNAGALKKQNIVVDVAAFKTDAFGATVEALRSSVGGFADAEGKTFAGSITGLKNQMGDLAEGVGVGVVDAFSKMLGAIDPLVSTFSKLNPEVQSTIGYIATFGSIASVAVGFASTMIGALINMRTNFASVADGIGDVITKIKTLSLAQAGTVLGLAALAAGLAVALWQSHKRAVERDAEAIRELRADAKAAGKTLTEMAKIKLAEGFVSPGAQSDLDLLGIDINDVGAAFNGSEADFKSFKKELQTELGIGVGSPAGGGGTEELTLAYDRVIEKIEAQRTAVKNGNVENKELAANQKALGIETDGAADATEGLTGEIEAEKTVAQEAADALDTLSNAIRRQYDEVTNAIDAQIGYEDALRDVRDGLKDNGNSYDRETEAGRKNVEMLRQQQDAIGAAVAQRMAETGSVEEATKVQTFLVEGLKATMRQAGLTETEIAALIVQYGLLPPIKSTEITAETEAARIAIANLKQLVDEFINAPKKIRLSYDIDPLTNQFINLPFAKTSYPPVRANPYGLKPGDIDITGKEHGGPVSGGMPYIVGERGPELFVPNQSGQIIPNGAGGSTSSAGGGGVAESPLWRMIEFGKNIVRGLAIGFRNNSAEIAMQSLAESVDNAEMQISSFAKAVNDAAISNFTDARFPDQAKSTVASVSTSDSDMNARTENLLDSFKKMGWGLSAAQAKKFVEDAGGNWLNLPDWMIEAFRQQATFFEDFSLRMDNDPRGPYLGSKKTNPWGLPPGSIDIFAREHGGPVSGGMPYIVGERGPELFVPNQSGQIIPNGQGSASSASGGGNQTIVVKIGDEVVARVVANAMATGSRRGVG